MQKDDFPNISLPRWKATKINRVARGNTATRALLFAPWILKILTELLSRIYLLSIDFTACRHILSAEIWEEAWPPVGVRLMKEFASDVSLSNISRLSFAGILTRSIALDTIRISGPIFPLYARGLNTAGQISFHVYTGRIQRRQQLSSNWIRSVYTLRYSAERVALLLKCYSIVVSAECAHWLRYSYRGRRWKLLWHTCINRESCCKKRAHIRVRIEELRRGC